MKREPKAFQAATAKRIVEIFKEGKQKRVLLADEVGLGKTIVAREVVEGVRKIRRERHDDWFHVVYICSNLNIAQQNTRSLGIDDQLAPEEGRLSMIHLIIAERKAKLKEAGKYRADGRYEEDDLPALIIPLTPDTSFTMTRSCGNKNERALMYVIIRELPEYRGEAAFLSEYFMTSSVRDKQSWADVVKAYAQKVKRCGEAYLEQVVSKLRKNPKYQAAVPLLQQAVAEHDFNKEKKREAIRHLRMAFAQVSLETLAPDLVIMDEFQRFSDLLTRSTEDVSEQNLITKAFFGDADAEEAPLILLLSATPYKPYTTLEELNDSNVDQHYEDFLKLTDFLFPGDKAAHFKLVWQDYSHNLAQIRTGNFDVLLASKQKAEEEMYTAMCRTERLNPSLVCTPPDGLSTHVSAGDVLSYCQMQALINHCRNLINHCGEKKTDFRWRQVPMEYVKSAPYLLSFMDRYVLKKDLLDVLSYNKSGGLKLPFRSQQVLLKFDSIRKYKRLPPTNARLEAVKRVVFNEHKRSYCLLWIPTSHPYYDTPADNVFKQNADFSKVLIFSSWEMVPRMLALMLSYEAERLAIGRGLPGATYSQTKKAGQQRLRDSETKDAKSKSLFEYASPFLVGLYVPEEHYGHSIEQIRADIVEKLRRTVQERLGLEIKPKGRSKNADLLKHLRRLDGEEAEGDGLSNIHERDLRTLADMAIGSPAVCLRRSLGVAFDKFRQSNSAKATAELRAKLAELPAKFTSLFNTRLAAGIIDQLYQDAPDDYLPHVLDYCVMGNLQAVLDEYFHMIDEDEADLTLIADTLRSAFVGTCSLRNVLTTEGAKSFRTHFSLSMSSKRIDEKNLSHAVNVRLAFNSPFFPFVLSSTSIGQEGLDFHWYCRKIVHWNIPANPQDVEQREGRINRYKCLAIRRNLARRYSKPFKWNDIFEEAKTYLSADSGGLIPYWCLPKVDPDWAEKIESLAPLYPLSTDGARYRHVMDVLSLYRLTMGQPRQEELLRLFQGLPHEQTAKLLFNLSPMKRDAVAPSAAGNNPQ